MERKINMFVISDAVAPTGFGRVMHSILGNLPEDKYDITWLGVNYNGDPHIFSQYKIYPAHVSRSDVYGMSRIQTIFPKNIDIIFILNDSWIIAEYLKTFTKLFGTRLPKIVIYTPVDAKDHDPEWYSDFNLVSKTVTYTEFGKRVLEDAEPSLRVTVIPHGINTEDFYDLGMPKKEKKKLVFPHKDEFIDSFVILNANRNQPRKMIDVSMRGFAEFAKDKPDNVKFYFHGGIVDAAIDVQKVAVNLDMAKRLIITSLIPGPQKVSDSRLNQIYNASDVGLNTSLGEGWGLTNTEHAATGAPQIVPAHSACKELFEEFGHLIPTTMEMSIASINTTGLLVHPDDVAQKLQDFYDIRDKLPELGKAMKEKFTSEECLWSNIAKTWDSLFEEVLNEH